MSENPTWAEDEEESDYDYALGYSAGMDNRGYYGGETPEWIRGLNDGTEKEYGRKSKREDDGRGLW